MKLADISGTKSRNIKAKVAELETKSKIRNITDLNRASVILRRVTSLELTEQRMRRAIFCRLPQYFS